MATWSDDYQELRLWAFEVERPHVPVAIGQAGETPGSSTGFTNDSLGIVTVGEQSGRRPRRPDLGGRESATGTGVSSQSNCSGTIPMCAPSFLIETEPRTRTPRRARGDGSGGGIRATVMQSAWATSTPHLQKSRLPHPVAAVATLDVVQSIAASCESRRRRSRSERGAGSGPLRGVVCGP